MPPHAGGQVIETEELLKRVRIAGATFHRVEQAKLPLQQRLAAPGKAAEDAAARGPELSLTDGRLDGRPLHGGERLGDLGDLPGTGTQRQRRRLGGDVHSFAVPQPAHDKREPFVGERAYRHEERLVP